MFKLAANDTALTIVDIQERLVAAMDPDVYRDLSRNVVRLIQGAGILSVPTVTTQQYTKGLGLTTPEIRTHLSAPPLEKLTFSCCAVPSYLERLRELGVRSILVAGMETHICILQTTLDLLELGYGVHVVADAVMSRRKQAWKTALGTMERAGAVITTTETALFQLLGKAGTGEFKQVSQLVK